MHLLNKFILVYIFILLLAPVGHLPSSGRSSHLGPYGISSFSTTGFQNISNSTVIGNNLSRSYYRISGNLRIAKNASLELINTVLIFSFLSGNHSSLLVQGKLSLYNSEITMSQPNGDPNALQLSVAGQNNTGANVKLVSSSVMINGSVNVTGSDFYAINSTMTSLGPGNYLGTSFWNSTVYTYNSTFSGERRGHPVSEYTSGKSYGPNSWYSNIGDIPLHGMVTKSPGTLVNEFRIKLTYGGYTYGNASYLLFNVSGKTAMEYTLKSTGYTFNETTVVLTSQINSTLPDAGSLVNNGNFSAFFTLVPYHTNTTIFNISITFLSNDSVALYGEQFYGPVLHNTEYYAVKSGFMLNYGGKYVYGRMLNPEKNSFFLWNGSNLYFVGSYAIDPGEQGVSAPFEIYSSGVYVYSLQKIVDIAPEGILNGTVNAVRADNINSSLNTYANLHNENILVSLSRFGLAYGNQSSSGSIVLPLLRVAETQSSANYCGNYVDVTDGQYSYFSENSSFVFLHNATSFDANIVIPLLSAGITHGAAVYGDSVNFTLEVTSLYAPADNVTLNVGVYNSTPVLDIRKINTNLTSNNTEIFNWTMKPRPALSPGEYSLVVKFSGISYAYNRNSTLVNQSLTLFSNVNLGLAYNYSWEGNASSISLNTTLSNRGTQYANNTALLVYFYAKTEFLGVYSTYMDIGPGQNITRNIFFQANVQITNATIELETNSSILPYSGPVLKIPAQFKWNGGSPPRHFTVRIVSKGLPEGTMWSVVSNDTLFQTLSTHMTLTLPSGSNSIKVGSPAGYHPETKEMHLDLSANTTVYITFLENLYAVTFTVSGKVPYSGWGITFGNHTYVLDNGTFAFDVPDGIYNYTVTTGPGFSAYESNGTFTVDNGNVSVSIIIHADKRTDNNGNLLRTVEEISIVAGIFGVPAGSLYYRGMRKSAYLCEKCWRSRSSRFGRCSCSLENEKNNGE